MMPLKNICPKKSDSLGLFILKKTYLEKLTDVCKICSFLNRSPSDYELQVFKKSNRLIVKF